MIAPIGIEIKNSILLVDFTSQPANAEHRSISPSSHLVESALRAHTVLAEYVSSMSAS